MRSIARAGVEPGLDQRGAALEDGREQHLVQRGGVEQRRGHQRDLVAAEVDVDQQVETFHTTLPWVSITPFGRPLVPEVYWIMNRSSSPTGSSISARSSASEAVEPGAGGTGEAPRSRRPSRSTCGASARRRSTSSTTQQPGAAVVEHVGQFGRRPAGC